MNESDHASPFPVDWGFTMQGLGSIYLSGQSSCSSKHSLSKNKVVPQFPIQLRFLFVRFLLLTRDSHFKRSASKLKMQLVWGSLPFLFDLSQDPNCGLCDNSVTLCLDSLTFWRFSAKTGFIQLFFLFLSGHILSTAAFSLIRLQ